jgi:hypothetical protein
MTFGGQVNHFWRKRGFTNLWGDLKLQGRSTHMIPWPGIGAVPESKRAIPIGNRPSCFMFE